MTGINEEIYLWGIFRNVRRKRHNPVIEIQPMNADTRSNCDQINFACQENDKEVDMEIDMEGGKEIGTIDVPIKKITLPCGFPEHHATNTVPLKNMPAPATSSLGTPGLPKLLNSGHQNSLFHLTPKEVSTIHPDVPPGFDKVRPSGCARLPTPKHQILTVATSKEVTVPVHPEIPPDFSKLDPSRCCKTPVTKQQIFSGATSKEVCSPSPDIPPGFGAIEPQTPKQRSSSETLSKKLGSPIHQDASPGFAKLQPPRCPNLQASRQQRLPTVTSKGVVSPGHPDIPPGFAECKPPKCLKMQSPQHHGSPSIPPSKVCLSSGMDIRGHLSSMNEKDHATVAGLHEIQSKRHQV